MRKQFDKIFIFVTSFVTAETCPILDEIATLGQKIQAVGGSFMIGPTGKKNQSQAHVRETK
jgi:hypothetical protein